MQLSPRMKWKLERYRRMLRERVEDARSMMKAGMAKQKVCPACRALVDARDSRCPFCNERLGALNRVGVKRVFGGMMPSGPRYTTILLAANFLLFGVALLAATRMGVGIESLISSMPTVVLVKLGARDFYNLRNGELWRLVTAIFLHANLIHLLFNSLVLFDIGPSVEEMYGGARFLVLYFIAGVASSYVSYWWHPFSVMVGASGAIFGLIGVMIGYGYRHRTALGEQVKSMYIRWAIFGLIYGFIVPGVDNAAHIGGLIAGIAFGFLVSDTPSFTRTSIVAWRLASYAVLLAITLSFLWVGLNYSRVY